MRPGMRRQMPQSMLAAIYVNGSPAPSTASAHSDGEPALDSRVDCARSGSEVTLTARAAGKSAQTSVAGPLGRSSR